MPTFAEFLTAHIDRTGIGDADLARRIGISRLTLIRWREGVTSRPRYREDVLRCAELLRLTPEERDELLVSADFQPEDVPPAPPELQGVALAVAGNAPGAAIPARVTGGATVLAPATRRRRGIRVAWAVALGLPGRYAVRPRLKARGFSRRAGRQGQFQGPTGLPSCLARTRSNRCR